MRAEEKELINEKFTTLTTLMNAHFLTIDDRLFKIETQTTKTNGSVRDNEKRIVELEKADIEHIVRCPAIPQIQEINDQLAEYKMFKKYPKIGIGVLLIALIIVAMSGLELFNKLKVTKQLVENQILLKSNNDILIESIDSLKRQLK